MVIEPLEAGDWPAWDTGHLADHRLVARQDGRVVGVRERLGRLHGRWRDVLLLERRSPTIG